MEGSPKGITPCADDRRSRPLTAISVAGFIVGFLDLMYAILVYSPKRPVLIPQTIASGLLGDKAYQGGVDTAVLGIVLHFFIAFSAAAIYYAASRRLGFLVNRAFLSGLSYGGLVYLFMHWVVLPLSAVAHGHMSFMYKFLEFIEHLFFVGLPISLSVRHATKCGNTDCLLCLKYFCWPGKNRNMPVISNGAT